MIRSQQDLIVLAADKDIEMTLVGLLERHQSLGIRPVPAARIEVHAEHDPGCFRHAHEYLRSRATQFRHALVILDHEGCGQEHRPREELERDLEARLADNGWAQRAAAILIGPEIEQWVWSDSPEVDRVLGWSGHNPGLRAWLESQRLWNPGEPKPHAPKTAMERALRETRQPRSSARFRALAQKVGLTRCQDPAFLKLREILRRWFAPAP